MTNTIDKSVAITKTHTEPPKRWRNRWICIQEFQHIALRKTYKIGDTVWGQAVWPSYEIAETKAHQCMTTGDCSSCRKKIGCAVYKGYLDYDKPYPDE